MLTLHLRHEYWPNLLHEPPKEKRTEKSVRPKKSQRVLQEKRAMIAGNQITCTTNLHSISAVGTKARVNLILGISTKAAFILSFPSLST